MYYYAFHLQGRQLLQGWGFRRCEDICWLKTNKIHMELRGKAGRTMTQFEENGLLQVGPKNQQIT